MPIRAAAPSIKGTTRVSFGDKQLIKRLWIADKNSTQEKNKRSREINRIDRERLTRTVQRKANEAFQTLSKQMRVGPTAFEYKEGVDDRAAVQAMCDAEWSALTRRHERATSEFASWCDQLARHADASSNSVKMSVRSLARSAQVDDVPLLHARKHKRACNFRAKEAKRRELLLDYPQNEQQQQQEQLQSQREDQTPPPSSTTMILSCDPVPRLNYERNSMVAYTCVACAQPVCSAEMVVLPNGAHDALYFHRECDAQRRASQMHNDLSRRSLLGNMPFNVV